VDIKNGERSMKTDKPFNELPLLPPEVNVKTPEIMDQLVLSARALAELKGVAVTLPSQNILIDILPASEAKSSSEVENIITTHDKLFKAMISDQKKIDAATKEVLRYKESLWTGYHEVQKKSIITSNMLIKIVQTITSNMAGIRNMPGTVIKNVTTNTVLYTPPEGEKVIKDKLFNLEKFINDDDSYDPLVKMAIIHYQFEAIHPFFDGNGRTGRILNILYLVKEGLLDLPVLYLSKHIIDNKAEYYEKIRKVTTHNNWVDWVLFMLKAVEETAIYTMNKITAIQHLLDETIEICKSELPKKVYSKELIELIFKSPYTTIRKLDTEKITNISMSTQNSTIC
jgi:Fic family protein